MQRLKLDGCACGRCHMMVDSISFVGRILGPTRIATLRVLHNGNLGVMWSLDNPLRKCAITRLNERLRFASRLVLFLKRRSACCPFCLQLPALLAECFGLGLHCRPSHPHDLCFVVWNGVGLISGSSFGIGVGAPMQHRRNVLVRLVDSARKSGLSRSEMSLNRVNKKGFK